MFWSSSPVLHDAGEPSLSECPTGMLLREAPWVFELEGAYAMAIANGGSGLEVLNLSKFAQSSMSLIGSELARHRREKNEQERMSRDAEAARRTLSHG